MESFRKKSFLNSTKRERNYHIKIPFSNVHLEGNDTIILLAHGWEVMPHDGKNFTLLKVWQYDYSDRCPAHGLSGGKNSTFHSTLHLLIF
jgi:hypothetical protein